METVHTGLRLILILFSGYDDGCVVCFNAELIFDDAKLTQGVKKRLKSMVNYALKFCKQVQVISFWLKKTISKPKTAKHHSEIPKKNQATQNDTCFCRGKKAKRL